MSTSVRERLSNYRLKVAESVQASRLFPPLPTTRHTGSWVSVAPSPRRIPKRISDWKLYTMRRISCRQNPLATALLLVMLCYWWSVRLSHPITVSNEATCFAERMLQNALHCHNSQGTWFAVSSPLSLHRTRNVEQPVTAERIALEERHSETLTHTDRQTDIKKDRGWETGEGHVSRHVTRWRRLESSGSINHSCPLSIVR